MASPPSIVSGYDPKNDPARKPQRSKDPAWRFGYWPNLKNRDEVGYVAAQFMEGLKG